MGSYKLCKRLGVRYVNMLGVMVFVLNRGLGGGGWGGQGKGSTGTGKSTLMEKFTFKTGGVEEDGHCGWGQGEEIGK